MVRLIDDWPEAVVQLIVNKNHMIIRIPIANEIK